ncbi:12122_t:CDS:2, partial [Dentiscutata heterogama]
KILEDLIKILIVIADKVEFKTGKKINCIKNSIENQEWHGENEENNEVDDHYEHVEENDDEYVEENDRY